MPTEDEWRQRIAAVPKAPVVTAHTYRGIKFASDSSPVVLACDDGKEYVVKSAKAAHQFRVLCNDQVMARIAAMMQAPVPATAIVDVPAELIQNEPALSGVPAGPSHGSEYMPRASQRDSIKFTDVPANRSRYCKLAFLYGMAGVFTDHQFFYEDGTNAVLSFDHGHFFPGGPSWTIASLQACAQAVLDPFIASACNFTSDEKNAAAASLVSIGDDGVVEAVAALRDEWKISGDERVALAVHLSTRRDCLKRSEGY